MQRQDNFEMTHIIKNLRDNNLEYFDLFYNHTKKQVYYAIMMIVKDQFVVEDIMQDTYMRFLDNLHRYKDGTNVIAFIVTIARNLAINAYNRKKREVRVDTVFVDESTPPTQNDSELFEFVRSILTEEEFEIFTLHVIDELKHREIAKIMKKPLGTITWMYNKAVKKIKERI